MESTSSRHNSREIIFLKTVSWYQRPCWVDIESVLFSITMDTSSTSISSILDDTYPYLVSKNVANYISLKLTSSNFLHWKTHMLNFLKIYDQGFITSETPPPQECLLDDSYSLQPNS